MQLGLDLAIAGHAPVFCPDAKVTGLLPQQKLHEEPKDTMGAWSETLLKQVPHLLKASVRQKRFDLLAIASGAVCATAFAVSNDVAAATAGALLAKGLGASWSPTVAGNGRAAHFHLDCWILVQVWSC